MWYNRLIINFTVATVTLFHHALLWYLWSGTSNSHLSRRKMSLLNLIRYPISPLSLSNASSVHQYVSSPPVGGLVVFLSARLTFCTVDSFWLLSVFPSIFLTLWCYFQRTANNLPTSSAEKLNQCNLLNGWPPIKSFNFSLTWELKTWQGCTGERIYTLIMWFVQERKKNPHPFDSPGKKKNKKKNERGFHFRFDWSLSVYSPLNYPALTFGFLYAAVLRVCLYSPCKLNDPDLTFYCVSSEMPQFHVCWFHLVWFFTVSWKLETVVFGRWCVIIMISNCVLLSDSLPCCHLDEKSKLILKNENTFKFPNEPPTPLAAGMGILALLRELDRLSHQ